MNGCGNITLSFLVTNLMFNSLSYQEMFYAQLIAVLIFFEDERLMA